MEQQIKDVLPTRRDVLRWGGAALTGVWVDRLVWPLDVRASQNVTPRGTAKNCILIEMGGAISPMDCWDFKETHYTPKDLDVGKASSDLYLSKTLFPELSKEANRFSLVRSMRAPELVHFQGQYHTQTGRAINVAVAKEIPAFGTVIAYELEKRRRETDTFPTYISTYLMRSRAGSIGSGFFPARYTGLDLDPTAVFDALGGDGEGVTRVLEERWRVLRSLAEVSAAERAAMGSTTSEFEAFYNQAQALLSDPRWSAAFQAEEEDKKRYGDDEFGLGCILARNLLAADAGSRFVYIYDGDHWDHHSYIFDRSREWNHYVTCNRLDKGLITLMRDLSAMPGSEPGRTLYDETLIVVTSEFGRTPAMNAVAGRDHYNDAYTTLYTGGGVKGGRIIGKTDDTGAKCIETGWKHREQPTMDNTVATIYSALGIDWTKSIENTPSGRTYEYVSPFGLGQNQMISNDEIAELFE